MTPEVTPEVRLLSVLKWEMSRQELQLALTTDAEDLSRLAASYGNVMVIALP